MQTDTIVEVRGTPGTDKVQPRYELTCSEWPDVLGYRPPVKFKHLLESQSHRFPTRKITFLPLDDCARQELHATFNAEGRFTLGGKTYSLGEQTHTEQKSVIAPEQTISYQHFGPDHHELRNIDDDNYWARVKDIKKSLPGLMKDLGNNHTIYLVVPKDPQSRVQLQLAFDGKKQLKLEDKLILLG